MEFKNILLTEEGHVAVVTVNRPQALNALNEETMTELKECFNMLGKKEDIRAIVLTGAGEKAFVAGADISYMAKMNPIEARQWAKYGHEVFNLIANLPKPVIAAVNGFALGGGCEIAMACDIRVAADNAKFGQPEINLGIIPGFAGTQRLTRLVGKGMAKLLIYTGDMIDANQALSIGLVEKVVPKDELMRVALELADKIASKPVAPIILAKELINACDEVGQKAGEVLEGECFGLCFSTEDQKEGMDAFLNKRKPNFK